MFKLEVSKFVCILRQLLLKQTKIKNTERRNNDLLLTRDGILLRLDLRMYNDSIGDKRIGIAYFVMTGNSVFATLSPYRYLTQLNLNDFENISNHDSCWRTAIEDWINKIYFKWAKEIEDGKAPIELNSETKMSYFQYKPVEVTYHRDSDCTCKITAINVLE